MQVDLRGKVAVVTGGNRGIGLAIAQELASAGCSVTIAGRDRQALWNAVVSLKQQGFGIEAAACDVTDEQQVHNLVANIGGDIDILVNNAGAAHPLANVEQLAAAEFRRVLEVNLVGAFLCCRAAIPKMKPGAVIVNNISVAASTPFPGMSAYNAAKAGQLALTNTLREELRSKGIRVMALIPGAVDTDIWQQFWPEAPREKMMSPEDIARAVVLAVSMPASTSIEEIKMRPAIGTL